MRILKTRPVHAALLVLAIIPLVVAFGSSDSLNRKILPSQIQTLTLRKDAKTTGRRLKPAPQLKTVGGDAKGLYEVEAMQCRNMGSGDGGPEDVQWSCVADLPGYFKYETISCGLMYRDCIANFSADLGEPTSFARDTRMLMIRMS